MQCLPLWSRVAWRLVTDLHCQFLVLLSLGNRWNVIASTARCYEKKMFAGVCTQRLFAKQSRMWIPLFVASLKVANNALYSRVRYTCTCYIDNDFLQGQIGDFPFQNPVTLFSACQNFFFFSLKWKIAGCRKIPSANLQLVRLDYSSEVSTSKVWLCERTERILFNLSFFLSR